VSLSFGEFSKNFEEFISKYDNLLRNSFAFIVLGDFNVDFNKEQSKLSQIESLGFKPLITKRQTFNKGSQLDWVFIKCSNEMDSDNNFRINADVMDTWFSDHSAIITKIEMKEYSFNF
jgi:endonuclease/exonuclease/phosphatase family metal-dependent hydrolase